MYFRTKRQPLKKCLLNSDRHIHTEYGWVKYPNSPLTHQKDTTRYTGNKNTK